MTVAFSGTQVERFGSAQRAVLEEQSYPQEGTITVVPGQGSKIPISFLIGIAEYKLKGMYYCEYEAKGEETVEWHLDPPHSLRLNLVTRVRNAKKILDKTMLGTDLRLSIPFLG